MAGWKFQIATFGCKVNQYESQALREAWIEAGGEETEIAEEADFILINSCAITGHGERNARNAVQRAKKAAPNARIVLTGCAAQFYADFKPRKKAPWAMPDLCVFQAEKTSLLNGPEGIGPAKDFAIQSYQRGRPVIKIQDGCSHGCAYCIVPQTRGRPVSREPGTILAECRALARHGYGELVISGINLRQYAKAGGFWNLLAWLDGELASEFGEKLRLRISSIDPAMLDKNGIKTLKQCQLICPHLHISLQHASPAILKSMGRGHYNPENISEALDVWPVMGLGADILVGFPGETPGDMDILLNFVERMPFTYAHVFPYSRRPGTIAAAMAGQITLTEKTRRSKLVRDIVDCKKRSFWQSQLLLPGMDVAADAHMNGVDSCRGVNEFYAPCLFRGEPTARLLRMVPRRAGEEGIEVERPGMNPGQER